MRNFDTTAADILADAGRAPHGERWRVPLAEEFGVNPDTMSKFMSGRMEVPDGLLDNVHVMVRQRIKELEAIAKRIEVIRQPEGGKQTPPRSPTKRSAPRRD